MAAVVVAAVVLAVVAFVAVMAIVTVVAVVAVVVMLLGFCYLHQTGSTNRCGNYLAT